jgi:hypothetical protein
VTDIRHTFQTKYTDEWITERVDKLSEATKTVYHDHTCTCGIRKRLPVEVNDTKALTDAVKLVIEYRDGKAAQAKPVDTKPIPLDADPYSMTSAQRQPLMAQLRARITEQENASDPDISQAV